MGNYFVRKDGKVCQLFTTPFTDWANPPQDETPQTLLGIESVEHLARELVGHSYKLIDRPPREAPKAEAKMPLGALVAALTGLAGVPAGEVQALAEKMSGTGIYPPSGPNNIILENNEQQAIRHVNEHAELQDKMLQEFRLIVAENRDKNPSAIQEVGSFIVNVCPNLEESLREILIPSKRRTFQL